MRYFLISYYSNEGFGNLGITTNGSHPTNAAIKEFALKNEGVNSIAVINIHEFKTEQDYKDFCEDKLK